MTKPRAFVTDRLELRSKCRADVCAMIESMTPDDRSQLSADWLLQLRNSGPRNPWVHGFSVHLKDSDVEIGAAGFKGPPAAGVVEIAYAIAPAHRGKSYATEVAGALYDYASGFDTVSVVRAHTLPDGEASQRVLIKSGFAYVGEVVDTEDGKVRRYEKCK